MTPEEREALNRKNTIGFLREKLVLTLLVAALIAWSGDYRAGLIFAVLGTVVGVFGIRYERRKLDRLRRNTDGISSRG